MSERSKKKKKGAGGRQRRRGPTEREKKGRRRGLRRRKQQQPPAGWLPVCVYACIPLSPSPAESSNDCRHRTRSEQRDYRSRSELPLEPVCLCGTCLTGQRRTEEVGWVGGGCRRDKDKDLEKGGQEGKREECEA